MEHASFTCYTITKPFAGAWFLTEDEDITLRLLADSVINFGISLDYSLPNFNQTYNLDSQYGTCGLLPTITHTNPMAASYTYIVGQPELSINYRFASPLDCHTYGYIYTRTYNGSTSRPSWITDADARHKSFSEDPIPECPLAI